MAICAACGYETADSFRFCPECGAPVDGQRRGQRKVVTVLFCDVVGSTALGESVDAEALRTMLAHYFERMKSIVERHGGVVEKFIGDAVMAVFGLPAVHEDDAVRALRAAVEMQAALRELVIEGRIGICSGEVVTGTEERLATGDAVNVAARLQQAAEPGEILLGEATLRLAREAIEVEPVEPLALKGKREPVPAWRLVAVSTVAAERRFDSPLVGRERELGALAEAWERARGGPVCELVTVVGAAGVGKSRLVAEFLAAAGATAVRGRRLSYGDGITYWPVVEVLKQLEPYRSRLELDPAAADAFVALLGQGGTSSTDEIAWAFRKLLEAVAAEEPIVVVFDDIQWGEDVFLDLLEHVAFLSTGAPLLLLCMGRPELLDRRSGWSGVVRLQPLAADEAETLMNARIGRQGVGAEVRERILRAAGGNPLFVEEMAAMVQASGNGEVEVPPTLQALLTALPLDGASPRSFESFAGPDETAPSEERLPQMLWRQARGKVFARRGEHGEAELLAREAVALGAETDMLNAHADALLDLAEVLTLAGRDARPELDEALALYERKGNLVMAERTRSHFAEVTPQRGSSRVATE